VRRLLVLWDVDHTLVDSDGVGRELYQATFGEMFGGQMPHPGSMAGRTDRAIALEVLTLAGVDEPRQRIDAFHRAMAARAPGLAGLVAERARALPGAAQAMAALAELGGLGDGQLARGAGAAWADRAAQAGQLARIAVVQSLLTGNIRPLAEVKLRPLGLTEHLDLDAGAYGDAHEVRAELVHLARANAARQYGSDFDGEATVIVGDTPLDVAAALATGARAVGVATGGFSGPELTGSGAHAVLPDLAATDQVLAAILGSQAPS
jgi:phosphoglycolate phosphatase